MAISFASKHVGRELAPDAKLIPINTFCAQYGMSRSAAYALLSSGVLVGLKVGARTMLTAASINAWLNKLPRFESQR